VTRRRNAAALAAICAVVGALGALGMLAPAASAARTAGGAGGAKRPAASAVRFRPRIKGALGMLPLPGGPEITSGTNYPLAYHGGPVMRDVTIHTIFWAPAGYKFEGAPASGTLGYEALVKRFFSDVAHDSGGTSNVFSVLGQYGDDTGGPGQYAVNYNPTADSIDDTDSYPAASDQCPSPGGVATCVTDLQLQREIDKVAQMIDPSSRGLNNIWFIFLPANVDTCVLPGSCASNAYAGYHSLLDLGHGVTVYAVIPDTSIELTIPPGSDPQGNADAEASIDAAAHEAIEAVTDPTGDGWIDPAGMEIADKCETGPEYGSTLGFASDGSPYNQVINGDKWLVQMVWSNTVTGCAQSSTASSSAPPLARVHLAQFSSAVSGNIGIAKAGVGVDIKLGRAGTLVGAARAVTNANGSWGPVRLESLTRAPRVAFGDDRDEIIVDYGPGGPAPDVILTGDGGDPFGGSGLNQAGWTGWFDLDNGFSVASFANAGGVLIGPCSQVGALRLTVGRAVTPPPIDLCGTETDVAIVDTGRIGPGTVLRLESNDNRAVSPFDPEGALVSLTVPLGEANSVSALGNNQLLFEPSGFPACTADLQAQLVSCSGLVPGARYALTRARGHATVHARADFFGTLTASRFRGSRALEGGDVITLRNGARRALTTLHVAHLRVHVIGAETVISSGTCEAGNYYGRPPASPPILNTFGAPGIGGSGIVCPPNGSANGLPVAHIEQTDDLSGGVTTTDVPQLQFTSPSNGATLYGPFTALAGVGITSPRHSVIPARATVALTVTAGGRVVFHAANVNTPAGVSAGALPPGAYSAKWVLTDANGDTRTVLTRFVEA
jgi:hypothetical protein